MNNDFKTTLENCQIVAFNVDVTAEGKKYYKMGVLQGRETCDMISCEESLGQQFNPEKMFDKLCRITIKTLVSQKGNAWTRITGIDFIKTEQK